MSSNRMQHFLLLRYFLSLCRYTVPYVTKKVDSARALFLNTKKENQKAGTVLNLTFYLAGASRVLVVKNKTPLQ